MAIGGRKTIKIETPTDINTVPKDGIKEVSNILTEPDKSAVVDNFHMPSTYLLKYGQGSPWPVTYYRRLLGENDSLDPLDVGTGNPSQQYEKIEGLILSVQSALDPTQDLESKQFNIVGTSVVYSVPANKHDFFTVEVGNGTIGVFGIDGSERKAITKMAVYEITYKMMYELSPEIQNVIDSKVVREYVYESARLDMLESPLMTKDSHNRFVSVKSAIKHIQSTYPMDFYDKTLQSLRMPTDKYATYDMFLTNFARNIGCCDTHTSYTIFPHPPHTPDGFRTVWWCLENQQFRGIAVQEMVMFSARSFCGMRRPGSIGWSLFDRTYFPKGINPLNVSIGNPGSGVDAPTKTVKSVGFEPMVSDTPYSGLCDNLPIALPLDDEMYIFSEKFYGGGYSSILEYCMFLYFNRKPLSPDMVLDIYDYVDTLPSLERYYYLPVCLLLLNYTK